MRIKSILALAFDVTLARASASAQIPVSPDNDHAALLTSSDPKLAANKRLVYDFWREALEAGHLELAEKYLAESYIQHNPNVPTGRAGFVEFFARFSKSKPIQPKISAPLVAVTAEGDTVILSFVRELPEPKDAAKNYTSTGFDMFRVEGGKIVEHWDADIKE